MRINYFFLYSSVAIGLVCGGFSTDAHALKINPYPNKGEVTAAKQDVAKASPQKAEAKKRESSVQPRATREEETIDR